MGKKKKKAGTVGRGVSWNGSMCSVSPDLLPSTAVVVERRNGTMPLSFLVPTRAGSVCSVRASFENIVSGVRIGAGLRKRCDGSLVVGRFLYVGFRLSDMYLFDGKTPHVFMVYAEMIPRTSMTGSGMIKIMMTNGFDVTQRNEPGIAANTSAPIAYIPVGMIFQHVSEDGGFVIYSDNSDAYDGDVTIAINEDRFETPEPWCGRLSGVEIGDDIGLRYFDGVYDDVFHVQVEGMYGNTLVTVPSVLSPFPEIRFRPLFVGAHEQRHIDEGSRVEILIHHMNERMQGYLFDVKTYEVDSIPSDNEPLSIVYKTRLGRLARKPVGALYEHI